MKIYLEAKTQDPKLYIDFIEVKFVNGEVVSLTWDESDITRTEDGFSTRYKGVYFNEEYADGTLDKLMGMEIVDIGLYSESEKVYPENDFSILSMEFVNGKDKLLFQFSPAWTMIKNGGNNHDQNHR